MKTSPPGKTNVKTALSKRFGMQHLDLECPFILRVLYHSYPCRRSVSFSSLTNRLALPNQMLGVMDLRRLNADFVVGTAVFEQRGGSAQKAGN